MPMSTVKLPTSSQVCVSKPIAWPSSRQTSRSAQRERQKERKTAPTAISGAAHGERRKMPVGTSAAISRNAATGSAQISQTANSLIILGGPHPPAPSPNNGRGGAYAKRRHSGLPLSQYWERGPGGEGRPPTPPPLNLPDDLLRHVRLAV